MRIFAAILLIALLFVGCGRMTSSQHAVLPNRYHVTEAALRYMFDKESRGDADRSYYSAYVIKSGEFTSELLAAFADYKPKVVADIQISTDRGVDIDKATGKQVMLWSVRIIEIIGDRATAEVYWHIGSLGAGGHTLHLRRKDGRWIVESAKRDWIS